MKSSAIEMKKRKVEKSEENKQVERKIQARHLLKRSALIRKLAEKVASSISSVPAVSKKSREDRSAVAALKEQMRCEDASKICKCGSRKTCKCTTRSGKICKQGDAVPDILNVNANATSSANNQPGEAEESGWEKRSLFDVDAKARLRAIEEEVHQKKFQYSDESGKVEFDYPLTWKHSQDIKYVPTSEDDVHTKWELFREVNSNVPLQDTFGTV